MTYWSNEEKGNLFPAEIVIANLPPANILTLFEEYAPDRINKASTMPQGGWGGFIMYDGVENSVTFQRFTRRIEGWVGGFRQTRLLRTLGPNMGTNLWTVGDSIFPGQSTAATALGRLKVDRHLLGQLVCKYHFPNSRSALALARNSQSD